MRKKTDKAAALFESAMKTAGRVAASSRTAMASLRTATARPHAIAVAVWPLVRAWAGRIAGLALGLGLGWYGMAAGLLIGWMVDLARASRTCRAYLKNPSATRPPEAVRGLAAAAALALRLDYPGGCEASARRRLFEEVAQEILPRTRLGGLGLSTLLDAAAAEAEIDLPALARDLACRGSDEARWMLTRHAYALARLSDKGLDHGTDEGIRELLADSGCGAAEARVARAAFFPDYREPWELLGIEPGSCKDALKRAYRTRCREVHPDLVNAGAADKVEEGTEDAEAFRELKAAYDFLSARLDGR